MADSTHRHYEPRNYRRVCDVCGFLRSISDMHKQDELWVCTYDAGERVRTELDRGNANQRPFTIKPVPYPKPQNDQYPNLLETDDAAVFNFLAQQVAAQCRYEYVTSGNAVATSIGGALPTMGWAARYFYDLIQENEPSRALLIPRAKELLATIATFVQTRQRGFGIFPSSTRASSAFYGGFLASGATTYITQDASTCGLALLYAYRVHGTLSYRDGARAAASYLRNVQAIGSNGSQFTSRSANGTGRLYTGAVCSEVSTTSGADPTQNFYSNHLFYPSDLLALEFWNELKLTDGDQSIGATTVVDGFDTIPAKAMSDCMTDMRSCWETGIQDATGAVIDGLSTSTPKEFFNAYPATKTGFSVIGTGLWEYADGPSATGTQITSQNFANALSALYNYEGATSQVTGISDWLRSFTSNPDFETPANISKFELYEGTTGTYDATLAPATLLQVRDPSTLASTTVNGSSLYDWGSFGLLSRIWASRNKGSFMQSRLYPLNTVQRFFAGNSTDVATDRITLRGMSGLTLQTGFSVTLGNGIGSDGGTAPASVGTSGMPASTVFYVDGTTGIHLTGNKVTRWDDQSPLAQNLDDDNSGKEPTVGTDSLDGVRGVSWPLGNTTPGSVDPTLVKWIGRDSNLRARDGKDFGIDAGNHPERTVIAVIRPKHFSATTDLYGGTVVQFRLQQVGQTTFSCMFFQQAYFDAFRPIWELYSTDGPYGSFNMKGPDTTGATYENQVQVVIWRSNYPLIDASRNGNRVTLTPTDIGTGDADGGLAAAGFVLGMQDNGSIPPNFQGTIFAVLVSDEYLDASGERDAVSFIATRLPTLNQYLAPVGMVNDAVRAAQFGRSFREARN